MKLFDYLNAITYNKKDVIEDDPIIEKFYPAYQVNKTLHHDQINNHFFLYQCALNKS